MITNLIPKPNGTCTKGDGFFPKGNLTTVCLGIFSRESIKAFELRTGIALTEASETDTALCLRHDETLSKEGYLLEICEKGVLISASTDSGVILALTSLYQLEEAEGFPFISLKDYPKYEHRGFMLDSARHFFTADVVKEIIEQNALAKLNVFHWHLTDDQGWRIESKVFPSLHELENQPYYTQDEIREIVAFAKLRGVDVVPEIDMPGHTTSAIAAFPELSCKGEETEIAKKAGIFPVIFCAGKESTYEFVYKLMDEVCGLFESEHFHLGGDEAPKSEWEQCEHCKAKLTSIGSDDFEVLQGYFMEQVGNYLAKKGKTVTMWNEGLHSEKRPEKTRIQHWLEHGESHTKPFIENGGKVIFSDMFHLYFDYTESFSSLKKVYGYTPAIMGEDFSAHKGCLGIEACLWSERVIEAETLYERIYPRIFALAEAAWTNERGYEDFEKRLEKKLKCLDAQNIHYISLSEANPEGEKRYANIMIFLKAFFASVEDVNKEAAQLPPDMFKNFLLGFGIDIPDEQTLKFFSKN
jgi:N-acetyl-beta-hexosaminidase